MFRIAWPLRKDDTHKSRSVQYFLRFSGAHKSGNACLRVIFVFWVSFGFFSFLLVSFRFFWFLVLSYLTSSYILRWSNPKLRCPSLDVLGLRERLRGVGLAALVGRAELAGESAWRARGVGVARQGQNHVFPTSQRDWLVVAQKQKNQWFSL